MNCNHVQNLLSSFIDRELSAEETRELRKHLFSCPECDKEYQNFLMIKNCLENIIPEPCDFDPMKGVRFQIMEETRIFLPSSQKMIWIRRLGLVAACVAIYWMTTAILFPSNNKSTTLLATDHSKIVTTPVSWDQNFSIDQSVSVYQASMVFP